MIPTCYLRNFRRFVVYSNGKDHSSTYHFTLQQWWSPVAEDGTPIAPVPCGGLTISGEWRDVPVVGES